MIFLIGVYMKTRVALCVSKNIGLRIVRFLKEEANTEISILYLTGDDKIHDSKIIKASGVKCKNIFIGNEIYKSEKHTNYFKRKRIDFFITVYWPWLINKKLYNLVKNTISFHPSLLPLNRGWYPHVHNIINNTSAGVTLHQITEKADQGQIWCQKKVDILPTDNAKELYTRLQNTIIKLFKSKWNDIRLGKILPFEQNHKKAIYFRKKDAVKYDKIDIKKKILPLDFINILRARSFGKKSFAYYILNGQKIYVNLSLNRD